MESYMIKRWVKGIAIVLVIVGLLFVVYQIAWNYGKKLERERANEEFKVIYELSKDDEPSYYVNYFYSAKYIEEYEIPAYYDGLPVVGIGDNACRGCESLKKLTIPATVKYIGIAAFSCDYNYYTYWGKEYIDETNHIENSLQEIVFEKGSQLELIRGYAFEGCDKLEKINLEDTAVTSIRKNAFEGCSSLKTINIPDSVETIGNDCFNGATSLNSVAISEFSNLTEIGSNAFTDTMLKKITIPETTKTIGENVLNGKDVFIEDIDSWADIDFASENKDVSLFVSKSPAVSIEINTEEIKKYAFSGVNNCQLITLTENVKTIGEEAFKGCSMQSLDFPYSISKVGAQAFSSCGKLTSINFYEEMITSDLAGKRTFGAGIFSDCVKLNSLTIPFDWTIIPDEAFKGCTSLNNVGFDGNYLDKIGKSAFDNCTALGSIELPQYVTIINDSAFANCSHLSEVILPSGLKTIGDSAFENDSAMYRITIPQAVTKIGSKAFSGCSSLNNVTFETISGWKHNGSTVSEDMLSDMYKAARALNTAYLYTWTRSEG